MLDIGYWILDVKCGGDADLYVDVLCVLIKNDLVLCLFCLANTQEAQRYHPQGAFFSRRGAEGAELCVWVVLAGLAVLILDS